MLSNLSLLGDFLGFCSWFGGGGSCGCCLGSSIIAFACSLSFKSFVDIVVSF
jgi:hypothetical protein